MSEPVKNPFDALLDAFRQVVREEIKAASKPAKALYTTKETADILNVDESWLSARARKGKIPHRMLGHYRYFSPADIQEIMLKVSDYVPLSGQRKCHPPGQLFNDLHTTV
jgi:Helix-turn-helix domain